MSPEVLTTVLVPMNVTLLILRFALRYNAGKVYLDGAKLAENGWKPDAQREDKREEPHYVLPLVMWQALPNRS